MSQDEQQITLSQLDLYSRIGIAALLLEKSPYHSQWPLYDAEIELVPPMHLDQCKFYFDAQQNPVAFVTWSNITNATKTARICALKLKLYHYE